MLDQQIFTLVLIATIAGMAMPAGALLASIDRIQPRWLEQEIRHGVIALGAGALISAVALVLVPDGIKHHSPFTATLCFAGGALFFMALDMYLAAHNTPASQLAAMLGDFIPESIALGTTVALGGGGTVLLGLLIAVQNLPEGFNAYREMESAGPRRPKNLIRKFTMLALLGPLMALVGYYWLSHYPVWTGGIMLFAAGGILYSVFQDIAPQIRMNKRWLPPMGGIIGFLIGMVGFMVEGG
ncbi:divalent cation transporter [Alteromonas pelagimontana]|uniref:Divalent cation transporter n=1 Tax=Alteromonas pelagimontana TaxID=1858656 RepID=A0A6M4MCN6_9ALTE|nr:divalent cation transporter [Alteromonas pelagimontana]QJR80420.1 divalent cation transporter [Alteromonas pelagimontana]